MPRRNQSSRSSRHGGERGVRTLKKGETRCSSCLAISKAGAKRKHQTGCPMRGTV